MSEPFLLSVRDFAREEGLGRDSTYRLVREGRIKTVKVGRTIRIPRTEITDFPAREINGREVTPNVMNGAGMEPGPRRVPPARA